LISSADVITDQYKKEFEFDAGGAGRIDLKKAFQSEIIFEPPKLIFNLSEEKAEEEQIIRINSFSDIDEIKKVQFSEMGNIEFSYEVVDSSLKITSRLIENQLGMFENRIFVTYNDMIYQIPMIVRVTDGTIVILENENELSFQIKRPLNWDYAKFTITNSETFEEQTVSITPNKFQSLKVYDAGKYWIEANIKNNEKTFDVYDVYNVKTDSNEQKPIVTSRELPERALIILGIIFSIVIVVGLRLRKKTTEVEVQHL